MSIKREGINNSDIFMLWNIIQRKIIITCKIYGAIEHNIEQEKPYIK